MENELNDKVSETTDLSVYEVSYLILPSISFEDAVSRSNELKEKVVSFSSEIISYEDPVLIDLAYQMTKISPNGRQKADKGYFGWLKFETPKSSISQIKKFFDGREDVLRFLVLKTVKENTLLEGKMKLKSDEKQKRMDDPTEEVPNEDTSAIISNDVDKSIDELVIA